MNGAAKPLANRMVFVRYLLVGAWNTLFGYGCFALFTALLSRRMAHGYVVAIVLANLISISVAFLGYKWFVFRTKGGYLKEWLRCLSVYSGSMIFSAVALPIVVTFLRRNSNWDSGAPYLAGAIVMSVAVVFSFFGHRYFSFATGERTDAGNPRVRSNQ